MRPVFNFGRHTFSTLYPKIGLEFHVQLMTDEKLFSPSKVSWNSPINTLVSPFDVALPGFLPRQVTKEALKLAVRAALLCGCDIKKESYFDRKHYLNKDLPSGYQITQYRRPFASSGLITLDCLSTRIKCIQLEHDSAKFIRTIEDDNNAVKTQIHPTRVKSMYDFNRCGVGLIEIVTEPDIGSAREAVIFAKHIQKKLSDHKITAGVMAHGNLRIDVNISLSKGDYDQNRFDFDELCGRVEIKNLNSFRSINKAIEFEISRQTKLLQNNTKIDQETRSYCDVTETTSLVRIKESKDEYIYIPEPDLGSLIIDDSMIESEKTIIRDYERINQFCLKEDTFDILKRSNLLTIFDRIMGSVDGSSDKAKSVSEFLINDLKRITMDFDPELVVKILSMYVKNEISNFEARSLIRRGIDLTSKPGQTFRCNSDIDSSSETNAFNEEKLENLAKKSADTSIELTADELKSIEEFLKLKPNKIDSPDFFMGPLLKGRTEAAELGVVDPIKLRALIAERLSWLKKNSI